MSPQNTSTSLATNKPQEIVKDEPLAAYLRRPEIVEKFTLVCGNEREAMRSIQSVILVVETAEPGDFSLQKCSHRSIVRAALRAATQRVSVDPVDREAYLVPRKVKRINAEGQEIKVLEACFQFHYQEILNRALRTNRYSVINVSPIFEGTEIFENIYTGLHVLKLASGLAVSNESAGALRSWNDRDGKKRIGWLGYYRTTHGQEKTVYMSIADIEQRVPNRVSFGWKDFREAMERKTVLRDLLNKADLKAVEMQAVKSALEDIDNAESDETSGGSDLAALDALEGKVVEVKAETKVEQQVLIERNIAELYPD